MAGTMRLLAFFAPVLLVQAWPIQENNKSTTKQYIVALKANLDADSHIQWVSDVHSRSLGRRDTAGVTNRHRIGDVHFYTGEFNEDTVAQIDRHSDVDIIEEDQTFRIINYDTSTLVPRRAWEVEHVEPNITVSP